MAEMTKKALNKIRQNVKRHSRQVIGLPGGMGH